MSRRVILRCPGAYHGLAVAAQGELDVTCGATYCRDPRGVTHHIFDLANGSYTTEHESPRSPRELRGLPGVREVNHNGPSRR